MSPPNHLHHIPTLPTEQDPVPAHGAHRHGLPECCLQLLGLHVSCLGRSAEVEGDVVGHAFYGVLS